MTKKGYRHTAKARKNMSLAHIGQEAWNKGTEYEEVKMEKHWNWKGGISSKTRRKLAPYPKPDACEICQSPDRDFKKGLCLDHDHKTGEFRGWICTRCNAALGMVRENLEILAALAGYIKRTMNQS